MDLDNLFSKITLEFRDDFEQGMDFKPTTIDAVVEKMRSYIDRMYESNDDDIEDFYDLISLINEHTFNVLLDKNLSDLAKSNFTRNVRIYAKKRVKRKFRDWKYEGRKFWNNEEAERQYAEGLDYIWKPSVIRYSKVLEVLKNRG